MPIYEPGSRSKPRKHEGGFQPALYDPYEADRHNHGGARRGAGAPKGNMNAYKTGRYSKRLTRAMLMLAVVPELKALFTTFGQKEKKDRRAAYKLIMTAALGAVEQDEDFAKTIKKEVYKRLTDRKNRLAKHAAILKMLQTAENNQTFKTPSKRRPEHKNRRNRDGYYARLNLGPRRIAAPTNFTNLIATGRITRWQQARAAALAEGSTPPPPPDETAARLTFIRDVRNPRIREAKEKAKRQAFRRDLQETRAWLLRMQKKGTES